MFDRSVGRLNVGELDMFVGPDFVVTIPNQPLQPVEYLFERCRSNEETREKLFSRGSGYLLYRIVDDSFDYCFPMLRKIGNKLDAIEDDIFEEERSEEVVRDISRVKQEIINFRKVIRPQRPVLRDLENVKQRFLAPDLDLEIYFDDIVDAHERIWDMLENYKEVVEALEETNESVLNHRVNEILRVLTAISVIVLPLTLIASIWGMNVGVPGEGDAFDFYLVLGADGRDPGRDARLLPQAATGFERPPAVSVNLGRDAADHAQRRSRRKTGIFKEPVEGRVEVGDRGARRRHGSPTCASTAASTRPSTPTRPRTTSGGRSELGRECAPGLFGENLTLSGHRSQPRRDRRALARSAPPCSRSPSRAQPCSKLAAKMERPALRQALRQGAAARCLPAGRSSRARSAPAMPIEVVERPATGSRSSCSAGSSFGDRSLAAKALEAPGSWATGASSSASRPRRRRADQIGVARRAATTAPCAVQMNARSRSARRRRSAQRR